MARFRNESEARGNAQANANATGEPWSLFSDTSGAWNSERWRDVMDAPTWSGVKRERIDPESGNVRPIVTDAHRALAREIAREVEGHAHGYEVSSASAIEHIARKIAEDEAKDAQDDPSDRRAYPSQYASGDC